jgi:dTDP-glucose 4,6-dehydratase
MTVNAAQGKSLPVYGDGLNVRDWLYVEDHCAAVRLVLQAGRPGETYNIGGDSERSNLEVVKAICTIFNELRPQGAPHARLIKHVPDRPGHDRRYAMDFRKITSELGWRPKERFETGLRRTISWYLEHMEWVESVTSGAYRNWIDLNYGRRGAA